MFSDQENNQDNYSNSNDIKSNQQENNQIESGENNTYNSHELNTNKIKQNYHIVPNKNQNIFEQEILFDKNSANNLIKSENNSKNIGFNFSNSNSKDENLTEKNPFIKEYCSDANLYGLSIQNNSNVMRIAVSSLEASNSNKIEIIELSKNKDRLIKKGEINTLFPQSKIQWCPKNFNNLNLNVNTATPNYLENNSNNSKCNILNEFENVHTMSSRDFINGYIEFTENYNNNIENDNENQGTNSNNTNNEEEDNTNNILAGVSDGLRIFKYYNNSQKLKLFADFSKQKKNNGPLTSMDWNKINPNLIGVCSVDTTCSIWDLNKQELQTHIMAHDKEVFDINFGPNENTFISTGADGSIRLFDLRSLDTCSVIFESQDQSPINRIKWNHIDEHFISATLQDKNIVYIIDSRVLNTPYACLNFHTNLVNEICWSPNSWSHICSVGDDKNALVWDISLCENKGEEPIGCYKSENEIENVQWSESHEEWIAVNSNNVMKLLKIS